MLLLDEPTNDLDVETLHRWRTRCWSSPAAPWSPPTTGGSSTASRPTSSPGRATARTRRKWFWFEGNFAVLRGQQGRAARRGGGPPHRSPPRSPRSTGRSAGRSRQRRRRAQQRGVDLGEVALESGSSAERRRVRSAGPLTLERCSRAPGLHRGRLVADRVEDPSHGVEVLVRDQVHQVLRTPATWVGAASASARRPWSVSTASTPRPSDAHESRATSPAASIRATVWVTRQREWLTESASIAIRSRWPGASESRTRISYSGSDIRCWSRRSRSRRSMSRVVPTRKARQERCCCSSSHAMSWAPPSWEQDYKVSS